MTRLAGFRPPPIVMQGPSPHMYNARVSIERPTQIRDSAGGVSTTYTTPDGLANIPAGVQDGSSTEAITVGAQRGEQTWDVYFDHDLGINNSDIIVTGADFQGLRLAIETRQDMGGRRRVDHFVCIKLGGVEA